MGFAQGITLALAVLSSGLLAFVVLLQEPKGGGIAAGLGGEGMCLLGATGVGISRFTCWVAGIWMATCFLHAIVQGA